MAIAADYANVAQQLYISYFGRPADYYGLQGLENQLLAANAPTTFAALVSAVQNKANTALINVVNNFNNSPESVALYGTDNSPIGISKFVEAVYENVLGRQGDLPGVTYWVGEITSGRLAKAQAAAAIMQGALVNTTPQGLIDAQTVQKKISVATDFTSSLDSVVKINAYSGDAAALAARNLLKSVSATTDTTAAHADVLNVQNTLVNPVTNNILSTGNDTITRADTVQGDLTGFNYNGKGPSLNSGDSISNVTNLQVTDLGQNGLNTLPTGLKLSNVQNITFTTNGNAGNGAAWDTTNVAGVLTSTVISSGNQNDLVAAAQTTKVTVNHNNPSAGNVTTIGGSDVTVNTSGGGVNVGLPNVGAAPLATQIAAGAVNVTQNGTGNGFVNVAGGTNVTVTTTSSANNGAINIGNTGVNTANSVAGAVANPTGVVTVSDAGTGTITVFGGTDVNVTNTALSAAGVIVVGDQTARTASNQATGNVTITETASNTFDGQTGATHNNQAANGIQVYGGASVNVTSNAGGNIVIGDNAVKGTTTKGAVTVKATGIYTGVFVDGGAAVNVTTAGGNVTIGQTVGTGVPTAADNPTGAVTVAETVSGFFAGTAVNIDGGTTVNVTANGTNTNIGQTVAPTGNVTVSQSSVFTGSGYANGNGTVNVGGGAGVTVNSTGGNVNVGVNNQSAATGAVAITETFSGPQNSAFTVLGGTTVNINTTATSGAITVGSPSVPTLAPDGITLKNANQYATGNVTIVDATSTKAYGTGAINVTTRGGTTVTTTGGNVQTILDANTTLATAGAGAGKPIAASALTTVVINNNQGANTTLTSNALTNLTVANGVAGTYTINNTTSGHDLNLSFNGQGNITTTVVDANAGTVTVAGTATNSGTVVVNTVNATKATFNNTASTTFNLANDTNLTSIVASNSGALNLGNVSALTKLSTIDATKSTGGVTATVNGGTTTFNGTGSSGNDVITLTQNSLLRADGVTFSDIIGGGGNNTIIANYAAALTDQALGNTAHVKNFGTLGLGASANTTTVAANGVYAAGDTFYDASGFSALTVGATAGNVTFKNVAAGATLSVTAPNNNFVNYLLATDTKADTLTLNAGTTATATGNYKVATTGIESLVVNSNAKAGATNTIVIDDTAARSVKLTGTNGVTLTLNADNGSALTGATSNVTVIDASGTSGAVNVSGVVMNSSAPSTAHTILGGAGLLTATGSGSTTAIDTITTGTGGGAITLGAAGSFDNAGTKAYTTGSQVIDLTASAAAKDTIVANDGAVATNNGVRGGVTNFVSGVANADAITFQTVNGAALTKTVVTNVGSATVVGTLAGVSGANGMAATLDPTGALATALANMTFTISNGVITFGAVGGHNVNEFNIGQFVSAAEIIVNSTAFGGANKVVGFSYQGNTYIVSSDANNTLATTSATTHSDLDTLVTLNGVSGFSGFGTTGAAGAIVSTNVVNADSGVANSGSASAAVYNELGWAAQTISTFGTSTTAINSLAASGTLTFAGAAAAGAVTIGQMASAGNNSLTLNLNNASTYESITVNGDDNILANVNANSTVKVLADAVNALKTVTLAGNGSLAIQAINDTALKTIDATALNGTLTLGTATGSIANDALAIKLAGAAAATVWANGAADVITQATGTGGVTLVANGAGDTITLSNGANNITAFGAGDKITVGTGLNTIVATGSNVAVSIATAAGASSITVGKGAVVTFTGTSTHDDTVVISNDVTGAGTSGTYSFTTLTGAAHNDKVDFSDGIADSLLGGSIARAQVNVAGVTTLAQALDLAANYSLLTRNPGSDAGVGNGLLAGNTGVIDWFQFGGDTYVVEAVNATNVNAAHNGLGANDYVVKITGLVDLSAGGLTGSILTL